MMLWFFGGGKGMWIALGVLIVLSIIGGGAINFWHLLLVAVVGGGGWLLYAYNHDRKIDSRR